MSRTGENIYKRKDGRWEGRYIKGYSGAKTQYGYIYGKTYKEVKHKLAEMRFAIEQVSKETSIIKKPDSSFLIVVNNWLQESAPFLKESSLIKYKNLLRLYILPFLGECTVGEITVGKVSAMCNNMLTVGGATGSGLSPKTVSDAQTLLKNILKYAKNSGLAVELTSCPASIRQSPKALRVLSIQEQKKIMEYLKENISLDNLGFMLCLFTGIRLGELCALKWDDISLCDKTIYIHQTMQRLQIDGELKKTKVIITTPKSSCSIRIIPIPDIILKEMKEAYQVGAFLLTGRAEKFIEPRTMQNRFKVLLKECNIDNANFHTLRHTFATRCVEAGFDIKSLSEILGHANVNITLNRYVHPTLDLKRANMEKLSDLFSVK